MGFGWTTVNYGIIEWFLVLGLWCVSVPSAPSVLDAVQLQVVTGAGETLPSH